MYAHWTANVFKVSFDANAGTVETDSKMVTYDGVYGTLPIPTRRGYTFDGWFIAKAGKDEITDTNKVTITADQTLYAHWTADKYKVTFNPNGGTVDFTSKTVAYDELYGVMPTPAKNGFVFIGWYTDNGVEVTENTVFNAVDDVALTAQWTLSDTFALAILSTNDLSTSQIVTGRFVGNTEHVGYFFGTNMDYDENNYYLYSNDTFSVVISEAGTYYFTPLGSAGNVGETVSITFCNITLDANNGDDTVSYLVRKGLELTIPTPEKSGYTFMGWSTDASATAGSKTITPTPDQTYYAIWKKNVITGDVDGDGEVSIQDVTLIQMYVANLVEFSSEQILAADVDCDGDVYISDATIIQKYIAGLISSI